MMKQPLTQLVLTNTLIQTIVPDELHGRVLSTYTLALDGSIHWGHWQSAFWGIRPVRHKRPQSLRLAVSC